ncbi:hypothetical protein GO613_09315 [Azoarcus communis]|uniref:hypothetical protein n=1 Tax=Parazoarcus communis TaxID=41977 RepID=UPI0014597565|nr:hypothetical protein [Parazoarcus communis]NMG48298.1 hypothetical protein [Parazoarcus communis]
MSQNTETTRAALVATLLSVPQVGVVHAYERYAKDLMRLRALYVATLPDGDQLRGWYVRRLAFRVTRNGAGRPFVHTTWLLRGLMALSDEAQSELAFDDLVDDVRRAIEVDPTLGGAVQTTLFDKELGAQLQAAGPVMFAGVLCHAADLVVTTETLE